MNQWNRPKPKYGWSHRFHLQKEIQKESLACVGLLSNSPKQTYFPLNFFLQSLFIQEHFKISFYHLTSEIIRRKFGVWGFIRTAKHTKMFALFNFSLYCSVNARLGFVVLFFMSVVWFGCVPASGGGYHGTTVGWHCDFDDLISPCFWLWIMRLNINLTDYCRVFVEDVMREC